MIPAQLEYLVTWFPLIDGPRVSEWFDNLEDAEEHYHALKSKYRDGVRLWQEIPNPKEPR